ncbi:RHTO0S08e04126g1_1 [Rhodotorula toruloides]|uniref:RHTO0S08e04126g1_1 n=1 Tax=Rhodotorula toruloides TaxID=5286 RepID=A0A061B1I0_RHOTO|nr:RHTO0S08e04126g1_1 [Rhodotorula toruloides]
MVLIDGVKYACQQCIKGHRSSKCTHTTRPLVEIKKKGRPTSQCAHCRELRKTKSVHARCDCAAREAEQKQQAKILPNGLVDAVNASSSSGAPLTATAPSGVTRLLNPCDCLRGGVCTCCTAVKKPAPKKLPGEEAAALAASSSGGCCSASVTSSLDDYFTETLPVPPTLDSYGDIVVTPLPQPSTSTLPTLPLIPEAPPSDAYLPPPAFPPSPPSSTQPLSDPLFLPTRTAGTFACFCGPTCACVGCAVHDPYSRKRPAEGGCGDGGGCRCGTGRGCEMEESKRARLEGTPAQPMVCCGKGKEKAVGEMSCCSGAGQVGKSCCGELASRPAQTGSCCGSKQRSRTVTPAPPTFATSGLELPSLSLGADHSDFSSLVSPTPPTSDPLPSLRTLWPAILDLDAALSNGPTDPSALLDDTSTFSTSAQLPGKLQLTACSAMFLEEPLGDACEEEEGGCQCDASCGCKKSAADEGEAERLAKLAASGAFG